MLKKWLVKKKLIQESDEIKVSKTDIKACNIYRNNRIMGTGIVNVELKRIEQFKFLRTKTSVKPKVVEVIPKPNYKDVKKLRAQKEFTVADYVKCGKIKIKGNIKF